MSSDPKREFLKETPKGKWRMIAGLLIQLRLGGFVAYLSIQLGNRPGKKNRIGLELRSNW